MKSVYLDAEMFGKASYFTALDAWRPYLTGICISASAFQGTNIINRFYLLKMTVCYLMFHPSSLQ